MRITDAILALRSALAEHGIGSDEFLIGIEPAAAPCAYRMIAQENDLVWAGGSIDLAGVWIAPIAIVGGYNGSEQDYGKAPTPGRQSPT